MYAPYTNLQFLAVFLHFRVRPVHQFTIFARFPAFSCTPRTVPHGRCAVGVILEGTPTAIKIANHLIINELPKTIAVGVPPIWTPTAAGLATGEGKGGEALGDEGSAERGNWFFRPRPEK